MTRLYIAGGGGFGGEVAMICDAIITTGTASFADYRFLDDDPDYLRHRNMLEQYGGSLERHVVDKDALYICAIGDPASRRLVTSRLDREGARFTRIVHPFSQIAESAVMGSGAIIAFAAGVYTHARIGRHVHINSHSGLGHDATVGDYCTLSAHVDITGHCALGNEVFVGSGARIMPGVHIGDSVRIGAGCTVTRRLKDRAIVYAQPPKFLSKGG